MSAALVRQALEFVDPDENIDKKKRTKRVAKSSSSGQVGIQKNEPKPKVQKREKIQKVDIAQENIKKLLKLSKPVVDKKAAKLIVARACKGKPLAEKIKVKKDVEKSILFPDD